MDHPKIVLGLFITSSRQLLNQTQLYDIHPVNQTLTLSVFSTGGYANLTLTIVALAIRLANKIKAIF